MIENTGIISLIKEKVIEQIPDAKIFLFGSRARGENSKESDFDVLIVVPVELSLKRKNEIRSSLRGMFASMLIDLDLKIFSESEYMIKCGIPGHYAYNLSREAITL